MLDQVTFIYTYIFIYNTGIQEIDVILSSHISTG